MAADNKEQDNDIDDVASKQSTINMSEQRDDDKN